MSRGRSTPAHRRAVVAQYKGLPMSVTGGFAAMHAVEGAAFLHDALMRKRAVKKAAGKKK